MKATRSSYGVGGSLESEWESDMQKLMQNQAKLHDFIDSLTLCESIDAFFSQYSVFVPDTKESDQWSHESERKGVQQQRKQPFS